MITDIQIARDFYTNILGCQESRYTDKWIDFDFYGNQLSLHVRESIIQPQMCGEVDGGQVPIPHFGVIIPLDHFDQMAKRLERFHVDFLNKPFTRFKGKKGEHKTMFFFDPFGNALEIKSFIDDTAIFV